MVGIKKAKKTHHLEVSWNRATLWYPLVIIHEQKPPSYWGTTVLGTEWPAANGAHRGGLPPCWAAPCTPGRTREVNIWGVLLVGHVVLKKNLELRACISWSIYANPRSPAKIMKNKGLAGRVMIYAHQNGIVISYVNCVTLVSPNIRFLGHDIRTSASFGLWYRGHPASR